MARARTVRRHANLALALAAASLLVACASEEKERLPGERISVLAHERNVAPDPGARLEQIQLPPAATNLEWATGGGSPSHSMQHLALGDRLQPAWTADIGTGASRGRPRLPSPVIGDGRIYTMDSEHVVSAFATADGKRLWRVSVADGQSDRDAIAGGITYENGRLFVASGFARMIALDAATGAELWRERVASPMHADPTANGGRVFATTLDSKLVAFDGASGAELWSHQAIGETARLIGGGGPAVEAGVVVAPFSSGELVALRQENGRVLWTDSLATTRRLDELATLAQIHAAPVIDRGGVFAISYGGVLAAIDLRTGSRVWEQDLGGLIRPWLAGNFIYQLTKDNELVCLSRNDGRVYWVKTLPAYENEKKQEDPILWVGPVVAGDRLIVASSTGRLLSVSPYDGSIVGREQLRHGTAVPPIVAEQTLFVLQNDATLVAYR
ncbi:MAG TPA: PQQ-binding-like beta-propeller repeat protein [Rhodospirillales bacterium]|nr:PQQ-binding-like beta-propeller repeat protein [Rhodospirillales bacterium]